MKVEKITYNNTILAIQLKKFQDGIVPLTDSLEPLQVLTHKRQNGSYTKAHFHNTKIRRTEKTQECLVVIKGKIKVDLYTPDKKLFKYIYLSTGEAIILMNGGHGVHILEDSEIIEIKNGPFVEDKILID